MGIDVQIESGNSVLYDGRLSDVLCQALKMAGHTISGEDGRVYIDHCGRIAGVAELLQVGDLLWQALEQPRELRCTKARIELKKAVLQGLALDLALQDWECNGTPPALSWG